MNKTGLRSFTLCIMSKYINRTLNMVNLIMAESDPFIAEAPKLRFGKNFHIKLPRFGNKLRKSGLDFRWLLNSNFLLCKIHIMSDFFLFLLFFPHFFILGKILGLCQCSVCNTDQLQLMLIYCMYYILFILFN